MLFCSMFGPAGPGPFNDSYILIRGETTTNLTWFSRTQPGQDAKAKANTQRSSSGAGQARKKPPSLSAHNSCHPKETEGNMAIRESIIQ